MTEFAIKVRGLRKSYGSFEAVRGVSFDVEKGEIFALLGPNGAGKTTIVEILEGHIKKSSGFISVLGYDPGSSSEEFRSEVGMVLQETGVEPYLKVEEIIRQFSGFYNNPPPLEEILDVTGLKEIRDTRTRKLSGGQKRRLDVAVGLAGDPELLFLDEPTTGFDPSARRETWRMISNLKELGKTVLLTTHYMDEAEILADRLALIKSGVIEAEGSLDHLRQHSEETTIKFKLDNVMSKLPEAILTISTRKEDELEIVTVNPTEMLKTLTNWAHTEGIELENLSVRKQSLEDIFLELTGGSAEYSKDTNL